MNRGQSVSWFLTKTLSGDQWTTASCALFCIVAALTGRSESSAHFWGLWQKGSSVQLSLLSWSVTTYRQTLVSDGFCSCTPFSLTDVTPVQSEAALCRKPLYDWKQEKQQRIAKKSILLSAAKRAEAVNCKDVGGKKKTMWWPQSPWKKATLVSVCSASFLLLSTDFQFLWLFLLKTLVSGFLQNYSVVC